MHVKSGDCSFVENNNLATPNLIKLPPSEYIMPFHSNIQHTTQISSPGPCHQSRVQLCVEHYLDSSTLPLNCFIPCALCMFKRDLLRNLWRFPQCRKTPVVNSCCWRYSRSTFCYRLTSFDDYLHILLCFELFSVRTFEKIWKKHLKC